MLGTLLAAAVKGWLWSHQPGPPTMASLTLGQLKARRSAQLLATKSVAAMLWRERPPAQL